MSQSEEVSDLYLSFKLRFERRQGGGHESVEGAQSSSHTILVQDQENNLWKQQNGNSL